MLNRRRWDAAGFHEALAALLGTSAGHQVLDLGCGRGASLGALLEASGAGGRVVGLDRLRPLLEEAALRHAAAVKAGRLLLVQGDILRLPFAEGVFDAVLCQNVAECVADRDSLVTQAHRLLRPSGRLLLGHHDFDGIMIASEDRDLTRRLVHGFADHQQEWQEASEGQMGRMIPGLVASAGFASIEIETRIYVDLDLGDGSYARDYVGWLVELAPDLAVSREAAVAWASNLQTAAAKGRFFFGLPWVGAVCRKADL